MRTYNFEFTGVKGGFMSPGETFNQKVTAAMMQEEGDTENEMIARLINHASSRGCYVSSIFVSDDETGFDIVSDKIISLFDANGGDLNSTVYGMLELFNWGIRDPADVHEDIYLLTNRTRKSQMATDGWAYRSPMTEGNAETPKDDGNGTLTFSNGDEYVGGIKDGKPNGRGTCTFANGDKYVGEWKDGQWNGQGTFTSANGDVYVGEFKDNSQIGQGTYTWADGRKYVGEWKDGKMNGQGTFTFPDGRKYVGEWKDNEFVG